jgi:hypothetical protein
MWKERTVKHLCLSIFSSLVLGACASGAVTSAPAPAVSTQCAGPQFRELDFWVGDWDVRWDASPNQPAGSGRNIVTRQLGQCVIQEQFNGGASANNLVGHSVSTYHAPARVWRQTWVDNQGGYFALTGGKQTDGTFVLENTRVGAGAPYLRMVFSGITPNSLTWRWQRSDDQGATWQDVWVIYYARRQ